MIHRFNQTNSLRKKLIDKKHLYDEKGNVISFDEKTDSFNFGMYTELKLLMLLHVWHEYNPVKNKLR